VTRCVADSLCQQTCCALLTYYITADCAVDDAAVNFNAWLGIAGSSTEYITECAEVSRGVSCWRCPSVLLPTAGCWMNAVDAVGLIQISTGAAAQRVRQWTHPPRTSLFRAGCSVWTERSLIDCWRITCPSTPRRLINLNIYSRKSSSNSLHKSTGSSSI